MLNIYINIITFDFDLCINPKKWYIKYCHSTAQKDEAQRKCVSYPMTFNPNKPVRLSSPGFCTTMQ